MGWEWFFTPIHLPQPEETKIGGGSNPIPWGWVPTGTKTSMFWKWQAMRKKTQFWKGCGHEGIMQSRISEYLSWTMLQLKLIRKKMSLNPILKVAVWHRRVQTPTWRIVISNGRRLGHPTWQTMTDLHSKICVVALAHVWLRCLYRGAKSPSSLEPLEGWCEEKWTTKAVPR